MGSLRKMRTAFVLLLLGNAALAVLGKDDEISTEISTEVPTKPSGQRIAIKFDAGTQNIGVFYTGNQTTSKTEGQHGSGQPSDFQALTGMVQAGESLEQFMYLHHGFEVRTVDMKFRASIAVFENTDEPEKWPFSIRFKNLVYEGGNKHMELKHSASGYLWVAPGKMVEHRTGPMHEFELRDSSKALCVTITLARMRDEL